MGSRSGFRSLGINSAWIQFNKKSLCDSYLTFVSFRRFSFRTNCFFLLSTNIGGLRKLFHSLICFFNQCRSWSLVDKDYWVFVFFSLTIWRWLMLCLLHSLSFFIIITENYKCTLTTNYIKLHISIKVFWFISVMLWRWIYNAYIGKELCSAFQKNTYKWDLPCH